MTHSILVVARHPGFLLGVSQALLKFGYQVMALPPGAVDLERASPAQPNLVIVHAPADDGERRRCLDPIRTKFLSSGVPVLVCVARPYEEARVKEEMPGAQVLVGSPLRVSELYAALQALFGMAHRRKMRISTELAVAHRVPGNADGGFYRYDTITSLSVGGCFIRTPGPHPVGGGIEMVFCAGNAARSIHAQGTVCHHGDGAPASAPRGMGIQFGDLSHADRAALVSYLVSQLGTPDLPAAL